MPQPCLAAGKNSTPVPGVLEHLLEGDGEHPGDLEGDLQRRRVLALLDGVEGLAGDADAVGQLALGHLVAGEPQGPDPVGDPGRKLYISRSAGGWSAAT